ncbi:hypothetical protein HYS42_01695 [Candidatus Saccharibacteria bacterium]|nr:hypothetical protein [Candidatus Saccharibacteria bacterium]
MGPKPIQDVAPPQGTNNLPVEPRSDPEIVDQIPVRAPTSQAGSTGESTRPNNDDLSFIVPTAPVPSATNKDNIKSKASKPRPALAIVVAVLALACLAAGAYFKFKT